MITTDFFDDEKVMAVKLNRGITNALDIELVNRLSEILNKTKNDPGVRGLVFGSSNEKFFSLGFDIPHLYGLEEEEFMSFYRAFNRMCLDLYTFPKPTAAALTGHAIAGGCILALCCDYRFMSEGKKLMGLNEIKLGVPIPYPADCILRSVVSAAYAREIVETGEFYPAAQLLQMGLVDQVLPTAEVWPHSVQKISLLGSYSPKAFELIKRNRVEPVKEQVMKRLTERETSFKECWYSQPARQLLKEAIEKF